MTLKTLDQLMGYGRLTERKVKYIVRHKQRGKANREIAFEMRVSISTIKRVWSYWLTHKEYLPIKRRGRPKMELTEEREIIKEAKAKYKLGAGRTRKDNRTGIRHAYPTQSYTQISIRGRLGKGGTKEEEKEKAVHKIRK